MRNFYNNKVKFNFYTTLLRLTFIWYLILKILCSTVSFPCGKGSKQQYLDLKLGLKIWIVLQKHFLVTLAT